MSKLYGTVTGDRAKTSATRQGHKRITAHIRGWHDGVRVFGYVLPDGLTKWEVWRTGGSSGDGNKLLVGEWIEGQPIERVDWP